jgi:hypothetical protein
MPTTKTPAPAAVETLREYVDSRGASLGVDPAGGVIRGVKILGLVSRNGREYDAAAVAKAKPLYEGAKVNVNHSRGNPSGPRDYQDRMGQVRQVRVAADGLYGDFHFNPKHPLAEQLLWDAEHAPENVGFSHNVEARTSKRGGKVVVEEITNVTSVDLVADPATTRGLFEDRYFEGPIADKIEADAARKAICTTTCCAIDLMRTAMYSDELSNEGRKKEIARIAADLQRELSDPSPAVVASTEPETEEIHEMDPKEITLDWLKANRTDLVEQLTGNDAASKLSRELEAQKAAGAKLQEDLKAANSKLAAIEAEQAQAAKAKAISEELKAAGLDLSDDVAGKALREQLDAAPDADARKRLIEALVAIRGNVSQTTASYASAAPLSPVSGADAVGPVKTTEEFVSRLR